MTSVGIAGPGDIDLLLTLMREYYTFEHLDFDEAQARRNATALLADASLRRAWLFRDEGGPVGYGVLAIGFGLEFGKDAFLDELYVREHARGRGLGKLAMQTIEAEAHAMGVKAIHLQVDPENEPAQALYRRSGFEPLNRLTLTKRLS